MADAPPSPWTCVDCEFSALYPEAFAPWRRQLGLGMLVAGAIAVTPLPLFAWRSRSVFALHVRQPLVLAVSCCGLLLSLVAAYRCVPSVAREGARDSVPAGLRVFRVEYGGAVASACGEAGSGR